MKNKLVNLSNRQETDQYITNFISDLEKLLEQYEIERIWGFDDETINIESKGINYSIFHSEKN